LSLLNTKDVSTWIVRLSPTRSGKEKTSEKYQKCFHQKCGGINVLYDC